MDNALKTLLPCLSSRLPKAYKLSAKNSITEEMSQFHESASYYFTNEFFIVSSVGHSNYMFNYEGVPLLENQRILANNGFSVADWGNFRSFLTLDHISSVPVSAWSKTSRYSISNNQTQDIAILDKTGKPLFFINSQTDLKHELPNYRLGQKDNLETRVIFDRQNNFTIHYILTDTKYEYGEYVSEKFHLAKKFSAEGQFIKKLNDTEIAALDINEPKRNGLTWSWDEKTRPFTLKIQSSDKKTTSINFPDLDFLTVQCGEGYEHSDYRIKECSKRAPRIFINADTYELIMLSSILFNSSDPKYQFNNGELGDVQIYRFKPVF